MTKAERDLLESIAQALMLLLADSATRGAGNTTELLGTMAELARNSGRVRTQP